MSLMHIDSTLARALGLRKDVSRSDVARALASVADLRLAHDAGRGTVDLLVTLADELQHCLDDGPVVICERAAAGARSVMGDVDEGTAVGILLDFGMGGEPLSGGDVRTVARAARRLLAKRVEALAVKVLREWAADGALRVA